MKPGKETVIAFLSGDVLVMAVSLSIGDIIATLVLGFVGGVGGLGAKYAWDKIVKPWINK